VHGELIGRLVTVRQSVGEPFDALLHAFHQPGVAEWGVRPVLPQLGLGEGCARCVGEFGGRIDGWIDDGIDVVLYTGGEVLSVERGRIFFFGGS
jgi:hypothetical protein